jgi:hypothetical protein
LTTFEVPIVWPYPNPRLAAPSSNLPPGSTARAGEKNLPRR